MNILITGGAGFIGSHLAKNYIDAGHDVTIVDNLITGSLRNIEKLQKKHLSFHQADICTFDYSILPEIDIVYHLASPASPVQYKKHPIDTLMTNALGTYLIMEQVKNGRFHRVLFASTSEIYGDPLEHPQKESYWGNVNTVGPRACYDEAKRFAESLVYTYYRSFKSSVRIARIFNTYGPQMEIDDGRVVSNLITQALKGKPMTIYGDGLQTRSFCYVSDLILGLKKLAEKEAIDGSIVNLGNPQERTVEELALLIQKATKSKSKIVYKPIGQDDPKKRKPDITLAETLLDWHPVVDIQEGLKKTITYFKTALNI